MVSRCQGNEVSGFRGITVSKFQGFEVSKNQGFYMCLDFEVTDFLGGRVSRFLEIKVFKIRTRINLGF
jgi:hypothetical protein